METRVLKENEYDRLNYGVMYVIRRKVFQWIGFLGVIRRFMFEFTAEMDFFGVSNIRELNVLV